MSSHLSESPADDAELAAAIDASFGDGPPPAPMASLLVAGQRARRRRTATRAVIGGAVAAGVLAVAAMSVGSWDLTGASGLDGGVATTASPSPLPSTASPEEVGPPGLPASETVGVSFGPDGGLRVRQGTVVLRREEGVLADTGAERSYGLVVERGGQRYWVLAEWSPDGQLLTADPARKAFASFDDWLAHRLEATTGEDRMLVVLTDDGSLRPAAGVDLLAQEQDLDLGRRFAGPEDRTAAAEVRADGRRWYVLVRDGADSPPDYITIDPATSAPSFEAFLLEAAATYSDEADGSSEGYR